MKKKVLILSNKTFDGMMSALLLLREYDNENWWFTIDLNFKTTDWNTQETIENRGVHNYDLIIVVNREIGENTLKEIGKEVKVKYFNNFIDGNKFLGDNIEVIQDFKSTSELIAKHYEDNHNIYKLVELITVWETFEWQKVKSEDIRQCAIKLNDIYNCYLGVLRQEKVYNFLDLLNRLEYLLYGSYKARTYKQVIRGILRDFKKWEKVTENEEFTIALEWIKSAKSERKKIKNKIKLSTDLVENEEVGMVEVSNWELKQIHIIAFEWLRENPGKSVAFKWFNYNYEEDDERVTFISNENSKITALELAKKIGGGGKQHFAGATLKRYD